MNRHTFNRVLGWVIFGLSIAALVGALVHFTIPVRTVNLIASPILAVMAVWIYPNTSVKDSDTTFAMCSGEFALLLATIAGLLTKPDGREVVIGLIIATLFVGALAIGVFAIGIKFEK